jgi:hypothetical protein
MDPTIGPLLKQIEELGSEVSASTDAANKAGRRELLQAAQKLCIALQDPGQIVEEFLFGVCHRTCYLHETLT